jgi:hypothetical protein
MRMTAPAVVTFGEQQHVIGQRRKQLIAKRTAVGGGLAILGSPSLPPACLLGFR